ncbi:MAG: DUF1611 domain-containing protein [Phycisphaerae bacterium]|nr:DUF1611 domain-containing protein [Phycisphaerae bacterium]
MHILPHYQHLLLLTEGQLGVFTSKTAAVLLRYRSGDVVAVVDSVAAGKNLAEFIPWAPPVPILADVAAAEALKPDALVIGVAPVGGKLPAAMRQHVRAALRAGIDVISGLHGFLNDDAELAALAAGSGARIFDLRRPPSERVIATARALTTRCRRVLTVGTDGNVGKMVAALELATAARRRGLDAHFLATGQTGIMIAGRGITIDACVADFAPGAAEQLVLDAAQCEVCFIEGQGSIAHPGFSAVTLALLHGTCPDVLILVHQLGRTNYLAPPHGPLPPLERLIDAYEQAADLLQPARVVALALNSFGYTEEEAHSAARRIEAELKLPVADPVRDGCERLLEAALGA